VRVKKCKNNIKAKKKVGNPSETSMVVFVLSND